MRTGSADPGAPSRNRRLALATLLLLVVLILTVELGEAVLGGMGLGWLVIVLFVVEVLLWVLVVRVQLPRV